MNAITLWQPWASAIAVGLKTIETRSWPAPEWAIGKRLAIASAKKDTPELQNRWVVMLHSDPSYLQAFAADGFDTWDSLPKGFVICTARLAGCTEIVGGDFERRCVGATEAAWGDYTPGRFAWHLADIKVLRKPAPVKGRQKIYQWKR